MAVQSPEALRKVSGYRGLQTAEYTQYEWLA